MGIVFQAYSLFLDMLPATRWPSGSASRRRQGRAVKKRAAETLDLVGLGGYANRYPQRASGGQQQRVALARALAIRPQVLLLDEPLSALDAKVRRQLREEIRRIQIAVGTTALFVTHDQEEALALGDRVGVMSAGRLEQIAAPAELYDRPRTRFVAEFVGLTNRIDGALPRRRPRRADPRHDGSRCSRARRRRAPVKALVRPENVRLVRTEDGHGPGGRGQLPRLAVPRPGHPARRHPGRRSDVGRPTRATWPPGTRVNVGVVPAPVFAVADPESQGLTQASVATPPPPPPQDHRADPRHRRGPRDRHPRRREWAGRALRRRSLPRGRALGPDAARSLRLLRREHDPGRRGRASAGTATRGPSRRTGSAGSSRSARRRWAPPTPKSPSR